MHIAVIGGGVLGTMIAIRLAEFGRSVSSARAAACSDARNLELAMRMEPG